MKRFIRIIESSTLLSKISGFDRSTHRPDFASVAVAQQYNRTAEPTSASAHPLYSFAEGSAK